MATIDEWLENGQTEPSEIPSEEACDKYFKTLADNKIDMKSNYTKLLDDGLSAFKDSFKDLLNKLQKD